MHTNAKNLIHFSNIPTELEPRDINLEAEILSQNIILSNEFITKKY
jgi:hypothetical protein